MEYFDEAPASVQLRILFAIVSWIIAVSFFLGCSLAACDCFVNTSSPHRQDERWKRRGHIHADVPVLEPHEAPLSMERSGHSQSDRAACRAVAAAIGIQAANGEGNMPSQTNTEMLGVHAAKHHVLVRLTQHVVRDATVFHEPEHVESSMMTHDSESCCDTPALRGLAMFFNPFVFMFVGLALWPWAYITEAECTPLPADFFDRVDCERALEDKSTRFTAFLAVSCVCLVFMLCASCSASTRLSGIKGFTAFKQRFDAVASVGRAAPQPALNVQCHWYSSHSHGSGKNRRTIVTNRDSFDISSLPGFPRLVVVDNTPSLEPLEDLLKRSGAPAAYVYTRVLFQPRGKARRLLGGTLTAMKAYASTCDTRSHASMVMGMELEGMPVREGKTISNTQVVLDSVNLDSVKTQLSPVGCLPPGLSHLAHLILAALGLMPMCVARVERTLPEVVLTIVKDVYVEGDVPGGAATAPWEGGASGAAVVNVGGSPGVGGGPTFAATNPVMVSSAGGGGGEGLPSAPYPGMGGGGGMAPYPPAGGGGGYPAASPSAAGPAPYPTTDGGAAGLPPPSYNGGASSGGPGYASPGYPSYGSAPGMPPAYSSPSAPPAYPGMPPAYSGGTGFGAMFGSSGAQKGDFSF